MTPQVGQSVRAEAQRAKTSETASETKRVVPIRALLESELSNVKAGSAPHTGVGRSGGVVMFYADGQLLS